MIITVLAWLTVIGLPILLILLVVWLVRNFPRSTPYEYTPSWKSPMWQSTETKTTMKESVCPEVTSIDEESFLRDEMKTSNDRIVEAGTRVYRIYRSADGVQWAECDPALTERAACNYADYIKRSNPAEFVRCDDPNGVILFYE